MWKNIDDEEYLPKKRRLVGVNKISVCEFSFSFSFVFHVPLLTCGLNTLRPEPNNSSFLNYHHVCRIVLFPCSLDHDSGVNFPVGLAVLAGSRSPS